MMKSTKGKKPPFTLNLLNVVVQPVQKKDQLANLCSLIMVGIVGCSVSKYFEIYPKWFCPE
jgi:hypothetical protein